MLLRALNLPMNALLAAGAVSLRLRDNLAGLLLHTNDITRLLVRIVARFPLVFRNFSLTTEQMYVIGWESVPLVTVTAIFFGAETVLQAQYQFSGFIPNKFLGVAVCKGIINELGPVMTSLIVSARVSTAIAAEIGSMKSTEQLDAMTILRLDPARYLFMPKVIACLVMLPVLTIWCEVMAILASIVTVLVSIDCTMYVYLSGLQFLFNPLDLFTGLARTCVFGGIIALTGCHFGMQARGGAEGVGNATTRAVMTAAVLILIFDYVISMVIW
jgi:phospholipid/cholesterol/gamma-HCH transport system permease protein